jgi:hypothetical protein
MCVGDASQQSTWIYGCQQNDQVKGTFSGARNASRSVEADKFSMGSSNCTSDHGSGYDHRASATIVLQNLGLYAVGASALFTC